jgi:hypothetical protein
MNILPVQYISQIELHRLVIACPERRAKWSLLDVSTTSGHYGQAPTCKSLYIDPDICFLPGVSSPENTALHVRCTIYSIRLSFHHRVAQSKWSSGTG